MIGTTQPQPQSTGLSKQVQCDSELQQGIHIQLKLSSDFASLRLKAIEKSFKIVLEEQKQFFQNVSSDQSDPDLVLKQYQTVVQERVKTFTEQSEAKLQKSMTEGELLASRYCSKQYFYFFFHLLMYQGSYTTLIPFATNNPVCFWFPVVDDTQEVVIALCQELYSCHLQRFLVFLSSSKRFKDLDYDSLKSECMEFLEDVTDNRASVPLATRNAVQCAFGSIDKPTIKYVKCSLLRDMQLAAKHQEVEYGCTGLPFGPEHIPSQTMFTELNREYDCDKMMNKEEKVTSFLLKFPNYTGAINTSQILPIPAPLSLSAEICNHLAYKQFFNTPFFANITAELKWTPEKFSLYKNWNKDIHLQPLWTFDESQKIRSWIQEVSSSLELSRSLFHDGWKYRKISKNFSKWYHKMKLLQTRFEQWCQTQSKLPDSFDLLPRDLSQEVEKEFTTTSS